ncbi:hypothetical protein [Streptomyces sp. NPDC059753]|uniref:hypothetical protein n=1 Tax=Streptomyces sp. NPDC059753 TaxID=3346933 RepID=UPI00365C709F
MAPIVVHPPFGTGGRRMTVLGQVLGLAYADRDVIEFLRRAGLPDAEELPDDPDKRPRARPPEASERARVLQVPDQDTRRFVDAPLPEVVPM